MTIRYLRVRRILKKRRLWIRVGEYIRRIEIDSLWSGQKHIVWELNRKVNILSGVNNGKSTILNKVILRLLQAVKE